MKFHDYIWDLGGTLLDNYEISTQAFCDTLTEFGVSSDHDQVYAMLKVSTDAAIAKFIPNQPNFLVCYKDREAKALATPILFEGAKEILAKIVAEGGRNFMISHRNHLVLDILKKADVAQYFTEVVTSESGFARKPNPESMLYLKNKYKMTKAVAIGDRDIDNQAAQAAGLEALLFDGKKSLLETVV
ncbi:HAD-IA family hydrolase [Streptococcus dentapri]|uniref:HAD-IA family hydrolase n=1 Tax=Streptococcus dentapri TaxID=573564 RepID=A0ABV8D366_9STRE